MVLMLQSVMQSKGVGCILYFFRMESIKQENEGPGGTEELVITGQGNKSDLPDDR